MAIIFSHSVLAGEKKNEGKPWERFSLSLGGFITTINSDVSLGLPGVGIEIDVEEALGLD